MADVLRVDAASILPAIWHPMYGGLLARTWLKVSVSLRNALKSSSPIFVLWLVFSAVSWSASTRFPGETKPPHVRWRFRFADVFELLRASCSLLLGSSMGDLWLPVRNPQAVPAEPPTGPYGVRETQSPCGTYGFPLAPSRRSPSSKGKRDSTASKNSLASRESPSFLDIIFFSLRNDGVPA